MPSEGCSAIVPGFGPPHFTCGAGHIHQERVGPLKSDAVRVYHERRARALDTLRWCPAAERQEARDQARAAQARRVTFREYAREFLDWAKLHHKGWRTEESRIKVMVECFRDVMLDALTPMDVEQFLDGLLAKRTQSTRNRYRTLLHAMLNRARRHGHLTGNPMQGIAKFKEPEGRIKFAMPEEEAAIREALRPELRPLFTVSVHTGLRWSEQLALEWRDVDFLTGLITVRQSKSGYSRQVPMNSVVRPVVMDLAGQRQRPEDPGEPVFRCLHRQADKFFPAAVERARKSLVGDGRDGSRLDGYTWHCNRHSFASRLVMAAVDLRTVQVLGGWRTLSMVQRYSHLAPAHLQEAVERLTHGMLNRGHSDVAGAVELGRNFDAASQPRVGVS
jgi:integrase